MKPIYECRCDERLQTKTKRFTRLSYNRYVHTGGSWKKKKIENIGPEDIQMGKAAPLQEVLSLSLSLSLSLPCFHCISIFGLLYLVPESNHLCLRRE
jgi:hypothetical protein